MSDLPMNITNVDAFRAALEKMPQVDLVTGHLLHAGLYARSIHLTAGMAMANVRIVVPTILIVSGGLLVADDSGSMELRGYHVLKCRAPRQNAFYAVEDTDITMLFATDAKTVEEAENTFTDEPQNLCTRRKA